jgi:hypothetical protein
MSQSADEYDRNVSAEVEFQPGQAGDGNRTEDLAGLGRGVFHPNVTLEDRSVPEVTESNVLLDQNEHQTLD